MFAALLLGLALDPQAGALAQRPAAEPPAATELRVVLAAAVYQPDGAVAIETTTLPNNAANLVYVYGRRSVCETATTSATEPSGAGFGWRLMTNTISQSGSTLVVSIDWRRMWDRGQKVNNGPGMTQQLTLHPGDRIPLDHIPNLQATDQCRAVGMSLEVRLVRAPQSTQSSPASPTAALPNRVMPMGATPGGKGALKAELWLMHTQPSGSQEAIYQTVRLEPEGGSFAFSTVKLATSRGEVGFEMIGKIQRYHVPTGGPDGSEFLMVELTRVVTGGNAPPDGFRSTTGGTPVWLENPAEVFSFEMPSGGARGGRGGAAPGTVAAAGGGVAAGGVVGRTASVVQTAPPTGAAAGGARGGGGAGGRGAPTESQMRTMVPSAAAQSAMLLEGNVFALRVRLTAAQ